MRSVVSLLAMSKSFFHSFEKGASNSEPPKSISKPERELTPFFGGIVQPSGITAPEEEDQSEMIDTHHSPEQEMMDPEIQDLIKNHPNNLVKK
jgi:hypothetical protein